MKQFRKDKYNKFVCEVCLLSFKGIIGLASHLSQKHKDHITKKEYFDKYILEERDDICKCEGCNNKTKFTGFKRFYKKCCSVKCSHKFANQIMEERYFEKHGVKNPNQLQENKDKAKITRREKKQKDHNYQKNINEKRIQTTQEIYGVNNVSQSEEIKQITIERCILKRGVKHHSQDPKVRKKTEDTYFEKTGYKTPLENPEIRKKCEETNLKIFGVSNPSQSEKVKKKKYNTFVSKGLWIPPEEKSEFEIYKYKVLKETVKNLRMFGLKYLNNDLNTLRKINKNIKERKNKLSIDHKFSIIEGFFNEISFEIVGSIVNLEIMTLSKNVSKSESCSITFEQLQSEYNNFILT